MSRPDQQQSCLPQPDRQRERQMDTLRLRIATCQNPRLLPALMRELEQLKREAKQ